MIKIVQTGFGYGDIIIIMIMIICFFKVEFSVMVSFLGKKKRVLGNGFSYQL